MENTINFSVRTRIDTLNVFDSIIEKHNLSRSKVIESFMLRYINDHSDEQQKGLKLVGRLSKFRGKTSKITPEMIKDDPRAKHAMGYEE